MNKLKLFVLFLVSVGLGAYILLSPLHFLGSDSILGFPGYLSLIFAIGIVCGLIDRKRYWLGPIGLATGQAGAYVYRVFWADLGDALWAVGLVYLIGYNVVALAGAALASGDLFTRFFKVKQPRWSTIAMLCLSLLLTGYTIDYRKDYPKASDPNSSPETVRYLFKKSGDHGMLMKIADHPNCPPDILEELAKSSLTSLTYRVAQNPNTPESVLRKFATDSDWYLRRWTALNPSLPIDVLKTLHRDPNKYVREWADESIRRRWASNQRLQPTRLAGDRD